MTQMNPESTTTACVPNAARRKTPRKTEAAAPAETPVAAVVEAPVAEPAKPNVEEKKVAKRELQATDYVTVRNGFNGKLVYKSRGTGEVYVWDSFGAEQEMELRELKNARNSSRSFYENNWFMFMDPDVAKWLGVSMYYKNSLDLDEIDDLFKDTPNEIEKALKNLPAGQKDTIAQRARELVKNDGIDSVSVIHVLERCLGITLLQR